MAKEKTAKQTVSANEIITAVFNSAKSTEDVKTVAAKFKDAINAKAKERTDAIAAAEKAKKTAPKAEKKAPKKGAKKTAKKSVRLAKEEYIAKKREEAAAKTIKVKGIEVPQLDAKADAEKIAKLGISIVDYSEKAFLIFSPNTVGIGKTEDGEKVEVGATMLLHKELAKLGGGYKNWARGWLFSKANAGKQVKELFGKTLGSMSKADYEKAKTA